jgi:hypothetical protein
VNPISFSGQEFSIDHLAPASISCPCTDIGRDLVIGVAFANHCYTESFDGSRHDIEQIIVRDTSGPRVFCPIRHGLSLRLPEVVRQLPNAKVYQTTQQRNYVYAVPLEIEGHEYLVFLTLHRAKSEPGTDLWMTIESAYSAENPIPRPKRPNSIRFRVLAYKVLRRQPVRFAAR